MPLDTIFSILRFGVVLSVLVFVHECGHFLMAKWRGVAVEEFGFGLPPRVWGKKVGSTIYSINALPIGGFVKLKGEEPAEVAGFGDADSFAVKSHLSRGFIIIGGVLGNFIAAFLIYTLLFTIGNPIAAGQVALGEVVQGSPAKEVSLQKDDVVKAVNGVSINQVEQFIKVVNENAGKSITLTIERGGQTQDVSITPRANPPAGQGPLGVVVTLLNPQVVYINYPIWQAPWYALVETGRMLQAMVAGLGTLVQSLFVSREVPAEVTGVVGIKALTDTAAQLGFRIFLQFVALLNLNLLIFNLLPVPALDGGRLLFVVFEAVSRRKLNPKVEQWANNIGLALLLLLFLLITARDVTRFY